MTLQGYLTMDWPAGLAQLRRASTVVTRGELTECLVMDVEDLQCAHILIALHRKVWSWASHNQPKLKLIWTVTMGRWGLSPSVVHLTAQAQTPRLRAMVHHIWQLVMKFAVCPRIIAACPR